jgi:hypothetical protein
MKFWIVLAAGLVPSAILSKAITFAAKPLASILLAAPRARP